MIVTPHARVIVYNYEHRSGYSSLVDNNTNQIDISSSIISIETSKNKSQPSGQFTVVLGPIANWVAILSPGSWLSIHMKNSPINDDELYSINCLKMIGRIDSVRSVIQVDPTTGERQTIFYIVGRDWGQIFESILYMDILSSFSKDTAYSMAVKWDFDSKIIDAVKNKTYNPTTSIWTRIFIDLWGNRSARQEETISVLEEGAKVSQVLRTDRLLPLSQFNMPIQLSKALGTTPDLASSIVYKFGKLDEYDTYVDNNESAGWVNMGSLVGGQQLWSMIQSCSNIIINEVFCDLKWNNDGDKTQYFPGFTLYKRVKPFYIQQNLEDVGKSDLKVVIGEYTEQIKSSFFNIRRVDIKPESILSIDYGTNWFDRINFVEITNGASNISRGISEIGGGTVLKNTPGSAYYDPYSYAREGFKPMMFSTTFLPTDKKGVPQISSAVQWVPMVASWYFNTHKMLNGTISLINHEEFIGVGDNISINDYIINAPTIYKENGFINNDSKILAHVESVGNKFAVDTEGKTSFTVSIAFVRGIITDYDCRQLYNKTSFGIDDTFSSNKVESSYYPNVIEVLNDNS